MSSSPKPRRKITVRDITPERKGPMPDGLDMTFADLEKMREAIKTACKPVKGNVK